MLVRVSTPQVFGGRYRLVRPVGAGGMGRVWQGLDLHLEREVAVKVVKPDLLDGPQKHEAAARFRREARVTAQIGHPGVPAIFDAGLDEGSGELYLVMSYLPGLNLRDLLDETGALPGDWTLAIGAQLASVLTAAHDRQVVHRDLKPANIIIGPAGLVHVVDFGIAAVLEPDASRLTATGDKPGTLNYMAPEQIRAQPAGPAADLYALGALLYEMATGERLFADRGSAYEVQTAHLKEMPEPVRRNRPDLPPELDCARLAAPVERPRRTRLGRGRGPPPPRRAPRRRPRLADPRARLRRPHLALPCPARARARRPPGRRRARPCRPTAPPSASPKPTGPSASATTTAPSPCSAPSQRTSRPRTPRWPCTARCDRRNALQPLATRPAHSPVSPASSSGSDASKANGRGRRCGRDAWRSTCSRPWGAGRRRYQQLSTVVQEMAAALGPADADTIEAERLLRAWSVSPQAGPAWQVPPSTTPGSPPR